jgi:hypothetical protein
MADTEPIMRPIKAFAILVELSNRIKHKADYEAAIAAFIDLDEASIMATDFNTNVTKTTTDTGNQLGTDSFGLDDIQTKAKQIVLAFACAIQRMRRRRLQWYGSPISIFVTRKNIVEAKRATHTMVRVLGLSSVVTKSARPVAECTGPQAMDDTHVAEIAKLKAEKAELEARITEMEAESTEMEIESSDMEIECTKLEDKFPLLRIDTKYSYTNQGIHGGGGAFESHLEGADKNDVASIESDDVASIVADLAQVDDGDLAQEYYDIIYLE